MNEPMFSLDRDSGDRPRRRFFAVSRKPAAAEDQASASQPLPWSQLARGPAQA
jgi:hypothetical protein